MISVVNRGRRGKGDSERSDGRGEGSDATVRGGGRGGRKDKREKREDRNR